MTISKIAKESGISAHTLRYYDKEGLLPFIERSTGGVRIFKGTDIEWLSLITCLKDTGMSIKQIKSFIDLCLDGDNSLKQRYNIFIEQKRKLKEQISLLNKHMEKINNKIWYYKTALDAGTEKVNTKNYSINYNCKKS